MNSINPQKIGSSNNVIQLFKQKDTPCDQSNTVRSVKSDNQEGDATLNGKIISKSPPQRKQFWMSDTPVEVWD